MKSYGVVRKVDQLGRITLPVSLRRSFDLKSGNEYEVFVEETNIVIQKYVPKRICALTGVDSEDNLELPNGVFLSPEAAQQIIDVAKKRLGN